MKTTAVTVLLWIGLSISLSVGASWAMLGNHAVNNIHKNAVQKEWFRYHLDVENEWRKQHTEALQSLHKDMKRLLERLIEK